MDTTTILEKVDSKRLEKATEGLASGTLTVTLTSQSEAQISGFVANGDGKKYEVAVIPGQAFCSCHDAMYRKSICKHAVALALYAMRTQQVPVTEKPAYGNFGGDPRGMGWC